MGDCANRETNLSANEVKLSISLTNEITNCANKYVLPVPSKFNLSVEILNSEVPILNSVLPTVNPIVPIDNPTVPSFVQSSVLLETPHMQPTQMFFENVNPKSGLGLDPCNSVLVQCKPPVFGSDYLELDSLVIPFESDIAVVESTRNKLHCHLENCTNGPARKFYLVSLMSRRFFSLESGVLQFYISSNFAYLNKDDARWCDIYENEEMLTRVCGLLLLMEDIRWKYGPPFIDLTMKVYNGKRL